MYLGEHLCILVSIMYFGEYLCILVSIYVSW